MPLLIAHVKWFPSEGTQFVKPLNALEAVSIFILLLLALVIVWQTQAWIRRYEATIDVRLRKFTKFVPVAVGVTAGLGLIFTSVAGHFLAPNLEIENYRILLVTMLAQLVIGVSWVTGLFTRYAAGLFLLLFILGFLAVEPLDLIDHLELVGAALYLAVCGRGSFSLDARLGLDKWMVKPGQGLSLLRTFTGAALVILALSEKLLNLELSQGFLTTHQWNILQVAGMSDRFFIIVMGSLELLLGLQVMFNILPRLSVLMIAGAMATTATILGPAEVPGHLFAVGFAMAVLVNDTRKSAPHAAALTGGSP